MITNWPRNPYSLVRPTAKPPRMPIDSDRFWAHFHARNAVSYLYNSRANSSAAEKNAAMQAAIIISDCRKLVGGAA